MRLLLDSHVVLWWLTDSLELGVDAREAIATAAHVAVSVVTPWELGIKQAKGKLRMDPGLAEQLESEGFERLAISKEHVDVAVALPDHHRDPFDRMLIAQAVAERLTLVSADRAFDGYEVTVLDARS